MARLWPGRMRWRSYAAEGEDERTRQTRDAIFVALAPAHGDEASVKVDVFDAEGQQLGQSQAAAVGDLGHKPRPGGHGIEQPLHFRRGQPCGQPCGPFGTCPFTEIAEGLLQNVAIQEHDGVERLILGGCRAARGQVL